MLMAPTVRQTAPGSATARGVLGVLLCGLLICGVSRPAGAQTNKDDLAATVAKLNKKAMDEYDNLNFEEARKILKDADEVARPEVIIASNTSSISITQLAAATSRPGQFIGMHFFNPVPMMALVEIIRAVQTSDATFAATEELAKRVAFMPSEEGNMDQVRECLGTLARRAFRRPVTAEELRAAGAMTVVVAASLVLSCRPARLFHEEASGGRGATTPAPARSISSGPGVPAATAARSAAVISATVRISRGGMTSFRGRR